MNSKIERLLDLAQASAMLNTLKSIQDHFCSRHRPCSTCPIFGIYCVKNDIDDATNEIDKKYFEELHKDGR